jgi:hypothetical protein
MKYIFLLLVSQFTFAQIQGKVVDASGNPVPYVNIWVENENIGTTSELDGTFKIQATLDKTLVFSAVGFETLKSKIKENANVVLKTVTYQLDEVVIQKRKGKREIEIGNYNKGSVNLYYGAGKKPTIIAKLISPTEDIKKHPFIDKITFLTLSNINEAKIKVRFYEVAQDGSPGSDYSDEIIIVTVKKGKNNTSLKLKDKNIFIPNAGLFIAFEWMIIEENKYTYEYTIEEEHTHKMIGLTDLNKKVFKDGIKYDPSIGTIPAESSTSWQYSAGKWAPRSIHKKTDYRTGLDKYDNKYGELAVKLTLTN